MRILLGFVVLLTGCCIFQNRSPLSAMPMVKPVNAEMRTPDPIPSDVIPELKTYHIKTRVIIEGQPVRITRDGQTIESMWWARKPDDVRRDLDIAESLFEGIGIKFHVGEISFREVNPKVFDHFINANMHSGKMTIVYMLPKDFYWDGYSSFPWEPINRGIIVHYLADEWTLSHEIGHYFGLLHPFDEDYVDDTPQQSAQYCAGEEFSTANCRNVMNYCIHTPKHLSLGQLDRFVRFLRAKRTDHLVREYSDVMLRGHEFPLPSGTKAIFNLDLQKIPKSP